MRDIVLRISAEDAQKIADSMKLIVQSVTSGDMTEIVFAEQKKEAEEPAMSSIEIAKIFCQPHTKVFAKISKFLGGHATEAEKKEFKMSTFRNSQEKEFPMYELTRKGCEAYLMKIAEKCSGYQSVAEGIKRFQEEIEKKFGATYGAVRVDSDFLLEGKPRSEYADLCSMFDQFITGPAIEGREIAELTKQYEQFHEAMKQVPMEARDSNKLESAMYGVAIEAEMQGFIYGFKLFDALLNRSMAVA